MNNYPNFHRNQYSDNNFYGDHYSPLQYTESNSLWQSPDYKYYDRNNFYTCIENTENDYGGPNTSEPCVSLPQNEDNDFEKDEKQRRIISLSTLFTEPEEFQEFRKPSLVNDNDCESDVGGNDDVSSGYDWTQQCWQKAGKNIPITADTAWNKSANQFNKRKMKQNNGNQNLPKKLAKALEQPVKLGIAESMMQKMGWQGGALGKTGDGIIEPIAPNARYSHSDRLGFGQQKKTKQQEQKELRLQQRHMRKMKKKSPAAIEASQLRKKNNMSFRSNVLTCILDFVRNDFEVEVVFDSKLSRHHRKWIHQVVSKINGGGDNINFENVDQLDIVGYINDYNSYKLNTQSEGAGLDRKLCLFKEAPDYVYVVTPDDFQDDAEEDYEVEEDLTDEEQETNPFLKSITKNLCKATECADTVSGQNIEMDPKTCVASVKEMEERLVMSEDNDESETEMMKSNPEGVSEKLTKKCKISLSKDEVIEKLKSFFEEFINDEDYTELWFLGPFDDTELDGIRYFVNDCNGFLKSCPDHQRLIDVLDKSGTVLDRKENVNGNSIIYKKPVESTPGC